MPDSLFFKFIFQKLDNRRTNSLVPLPGLRMHSHFLGAVCHCFSTAPHRGEGSSTGARRCPRSSDGHAIGSLVVVWSFGFVSVCVSVVLGQVCLEDVEKSIVRTPTESIAHIHFLIISLLFPGCLIFESNCLPPAFPPGFELLG